MKIWVQGCKCQGKRVVVIFRQICCNPDDLKSDEYLEEEDDDRGNYTALLAHF